MLLGYATNSYRATLQRRHLSAAIEAEAQAAEMERRNRLLMDAYGDRSSMAELEKAVEVYEQ
jgi:hypothetical protein